MVRAGDSGPPAPEERISARRKQIEEIVIAALALTGSSAQLIWIPLAAMIESSAAKWSRCWHRRIGPTRF